MFVRTLLRHAHAAFSLCVNFLRSGMSHWTQPYIRSSPKLAVSTSLASLGTMGAEDLAAFFTDDAVWHNIPLAPVTGRDDIATTIASFTTGIESIEFRVRNIASDGPVVLTEQVDVFKLPDKSIELPVMGTFEVRDGKIAAWRD